mgnify:CR=1 FL=1
MRIVLFEQRIADGRDQAIEALTSAAVDPTVNDALQALALYVTTRDR